MDCFNCNHSFDEKLGYCPNCGAVMCKEYVLNKKMCRSKWTFKKRFKRSSYIEEIKEWQDHQYDPGFYTGGRIPPFYKKPGSPKLFASVLFIIAATYVIYLATSLFSSINTGLEWGIIDTLFIPAIIIGILSIAGFRLLKKAK